MGREVLCKGKVVRRFGEMEKDDEVDVRDR